MAIKKKEIGAVLVSLPAASYPADQLKVIPISGSIDLRNYSVGTIAAAIRIEFDCMSGGAQIIENRSFALGGKRKIADVGFYALESGLKGATHLFAAEDLQDMAQKRIDDPTSSGSIASTNIFFNVNTRCDSDRFTLTVLNVNSLGGTPEPTPTPTPQPAPNLYEFRISAPFNPELPFVVVDTMRNLLIAHGWGLSNISRSNDGYVMQLERQGSVTFFVVAGIIIAALALLLIVVVRWSAVRLSDNVTEAQRLNTSQSTIAAINQLEIPDKEKAELIEKVIETYQAPTPTPTPFGLDPLAIGILGIALVLALRK